MKTILKRVLQDLMRSCKIKLIYNSYLTANNLIANFSKFLLFSGILTPRYDVQGGKLEYTHLMEVT